MKLYSVITLALVCFCLCAAAQTTSSDFVSKPTYIIFGGSYNQFGGVKAFVSGVIPEIQSASIYGSATLDLQPQKYLDAAGKAGYVLSGSARFGQHRQLYLSTSNFLSIGADLGPTFSPATATGITVGSTNIGLSSSFTLTYVRMIHPRIGIAVPVRMLWMSGVGPNGSGAWNPVVQIGLVLKP